MIDTLHLMPPALGPCSNPTLYGVAEALAELLPLRSESVRAFENAFATRCSAETVDLPTEASAGE